MSSFPDMDPNVKGAALLSLSFAHQLLSMDIYQRHGASMAECQDVDASFVVEHPTPPSSPESHVENSGDNTEYQVRVNPNAVLDTTCTCWPGNSSSSKRMPLGSSIKPAVNELGVHTMPGLPRSMARVDFKTNPYVKPPYSYITLISMAMMATKKKMATLRGIYKWVTDSFMYFRFAELSWRNCIKHVLSLNNCFMKVPRRRGEKTTHEGKPRRIFWRITPDCSHMFVNGIYKRHRSGDSHVRLLSKRVKRETKARSRLNSYMDASPSDDVLVGTTVCSDHTNIALRGDFNWNAIWHQDMETILGKTRTGCVADNDSHPLDMYVYPSMHIDLQLVIPDCSLSEVVGDLVGVADTTERAMLNCMEPTLEGTRTGQTMDKCSGSHQSDMLTMHCETIFDTPPDSPVHISKRDFSLPCLGHGLSEI